MFHAFQWIDDRFWIGAAGVDVFFVISGLVIWGVAARESRPGVFFWRRLTRVAPAYWLITGVVVVLALAWPRLLPTVSLSLRHVLLSLAFIQHTDPRGLTFPVLPPGWSLNYEAMFYSVFSLALFGPERRRFRLALAGLAAVSLFGFLDTPAYELGANPEMMQFAAGLCLARIDVARRLSPGAGLALIAVGLLLLSGMGVAGYYDNLLRPLIWGAPAAMIVAGAVAAEPVLARWTPRALVRLGDASYAIYLCHFIAVAVAARWLGVTPVWLFVPVATALSLAAGLALHRLVEQPLIAAARALPSALARSDFVHVRRRKTRGDAVGHP